MPYVPTDEEARRLRLAIDRASFSEAERIAWILSFSAVLVVEAALVVAASWVGVVGAIGCALILYWRLRGGYLVNVDREVHGMGLRTRAQRAFTALMVRHAFTGRNPLRARPEHDPFRIWQEKLEKREAGQSSSA